MTLDHMQQVFQRGRSLTDPTAIPFELRGYILDASNLYYPVRFPDIRSGAGLTARAIPDPSTTDGLRRYTAWIIAMSNQTDLYSTELDPTCSMCPNHWINKDGPTARPFLQCAIIVPTHAGEEDQPRPLELPAGDVSEGACCNCVMVDTIDDCDCNNRYWRA
jgi:hypothetical protein